MEKLQFCLNIYEHVALVWQWKCCNLYRLFSDLNFYITKTLVQASEYSFVSAILQESEFHFWKLNFEVRVSRDSSRKNKMKIEGRFQHL